MFIPLQKKDMPNKRQCPLKDTDLKRLIRQRHGKHHPRAYTLRLLVQDAPELKPRRVEVSLQTNNEEQALRVSRLIVSALHGLGFHFAHKTNWEQRCAQKKKRDVCLLPLFAWAQKKEDVFCPHATPLNQPEEDAKMPPQH